MKVRDRRKYGVTRWTVLKATKERLQNPNPMHNEAVLEILAAEVCNPDDPTHVQLANDVLVQLLGKAQPQAESDDPKINWEGLREFILAILPWVLKILSIFGFGVV